MAEAKKLRTSTLFVVSWLHLCDFPKKWLTLGEFKILLLYDRHRFKDGSHNGILFFCHCSFPSGFIIGIRNEQCWSWLKIMYIYKCLFAFTVTVSCFSFWVLTCIVLMGLDHLVWLSCHLPSNLGCTAGIGKLSTADGKAFADPEVLRRLTSSVSCALDEAAAALTRMRAENTLNAGQADKYVSCLYWHSH